LKILIADDNPRRYQKLMGVLADRGIDRQSVDVVTSANDARDRLDANRYDLFVLDILLPLRVEDEPDSRNALDLVNEVSEGAFAYRPGQMVGITADEKAAISASPVFADRLWTLVRYTDESDEWSQQIANCASYLNDRSGERSIEPSAVDVAIICALSDPELSAVLSLDWRWGAPRPIDEVTFVNDGVVESDSRKFTAVACATPRMGMVHAALLAAKVITTLRPRILIMGGICAGVPAKAAIGDVILFDPSWDWQSGKRLRESGATQFAAAPHQLPAPASVRAHMQQLAADNNALAGLVGKWRGARPAAPPRLRTGPVASGSAVLADGEVIAEIKEQHRELLGVEMEAYGIYAAAHWSGAPQPLAFALKAVCDFADEKKNDDYQGYAAFTSAGVIDLFVRRYAGRLLV
jgi:nucleoside phosphorylase/CheY-like chemotaxis protein